MGLDEILEVEKRTYPIVTQSTASGQIEPAYGAENTSLSRALFHFNLLEISKSISDGKITNPKFYLSLRIAESHKIPLTYTLAAYPLAAEWSMGTGYKYDGQNIADGANWKYSDGTTLKWWVSESLSNLEGGGIWYVSSSLLGSGSGYAQAPFVSPTPYDPFPYCSGSAPSTSSTPIPPVTGGFACSQSFNYQTSDVYMDVTTIANAWLSGTIPNYGLIVLHSGEADNIDYGKLRFFSKETNTIYSPKLDIAWDDSVFNTGSESASIDEIKLSDAVVAVKNMVSEYRYGSIIQFNVTPRKRYPVKTFTNKLSDYLDFYSLPYDSFYSIRDAESEEVIISYDSATRLNLTPNDGNYFLLDTTGLAQERNYKIAIRSEQSGSIVTFDIPTSFKISR